MADQGKGPRANLSEAERLLSEAENRLRDLGGALSAPASEAAKDALSLVERARQLVADALARHR